MSRADQMDEELSLFLLNTIMRGTSLKVSSMEEADRFYILVKLSITSGRVVHNTGSVSNFGQIIINMRDILTRTNNMLMERLHFQMVPVMRVNKIIIKSMDMEFIHFQMEMFTMVPLKITKDMG